MPAGGEAAEEKPETDGSRPSRLLLIAPPLIVIALFSTLRACLSPALNLDTYFHLRIGHEFLSGGWSLWHPGHMSSLATRDWLPTQWSTEVLMAQFEQWFGLGGVRWLWGTALIALIVTLYLTCRRQGPATVSAALTAAVLVVAHPALSARPQMISYILTVVFVGAWLRTGVDGRNRWWLVPVTWLWATAHGMWPVALSIGVVGACAAILRAAPDERRRASRLLLNPLAGAVAAGLTPLGPALYGAVLNVGSISSFYSEWGPPDFRTAGPALLLVMFLALVAIEFRRDEPLPWDRTLLAVLALGWGVYSNRTVPIAACILAPLLARAAADRLRDSPQPRHDRRTVVVAGLAAVALLGPVLALAPVRTASEPPWVARWLDRLPAQTRVLSNDFTGSYLSWRYPRLDILVNGYGDQFTRGALVELRDMFELDPGWDRDFERLDVQWALLPPDLPLAYALAHRPGWEVVRKSADIELLHFTGGS